MTRNLTKQTQRNNETPNTESLFYMLQTKRPGGSKTEQDFIRRWIAPLGTYEDGYGNHIIRIGDAPVMYSSHTDSVHRTEGTQRIKAKGGLITLANNESSNCLGADCVAGVWAMVEMIRANIPGLYVFHRDEESGGHGSQWIADNTPQLLDGIQACIALDRFGTSSIITHQYGGRCASDEFAKSMGKQFRGFQADDGGSFTDSANYVHLVPECTNLSVGYYSQHTDKESLDMFHLLDLRDMLFRFDIGRVNIRRKPEARVTHSKVYGGRAWDAWEDDSGYWRASNASSNRVARNVLEFVRLYPEETADIFEQYGITIDDLYESAPWAS